jgi:hypothetical protein
VTFIEVLWRQRQAVDDAINDAENGGDNARPPTGDDYNSLWGLFPSAEYLARFKPEAQDTAAKYWVLQIPVVSTCHISKATAEWLEGVAGLSGADFPYVGHYGGGFFVSVPSDVDAVVGEEPEDLSPLWKWARENDYDWIRLDGEVGDVIDGLPTYDW